MTLREDTVGRNDEAQLLREQMQEMIRQREEAERKQREEIERLRQQLENRPHVDLAPVLPQAPAYVPEQQDQTVSALQAQLQALTAQMVQMQTQLLSAQTAQQTGNAQADSTPRQAMNVEQQSASADRQNNVCDQTPPKAATDEIEEHAPENQRELVIPSGTEVINTEQYKGKNYERVFIPKSVEEIKSSAFEECKNLKEVVIEEGSRLTRIGLNAFIKCSSLAKINLPEGLTEIAPLAFFETALENITFPASLRKIG